MKGTLMGTAWGAAADNVTRHPLCTARQPEGQNLLKQEDSLDPEIDSTVGTLQESRKSIQISSSLRLWRRGLTAVEGRVWRGERHEWKNGDRLIAANPVWSLPLHFILEKNAERGVGRKSNANTTIPFPDLLCISQPCL